MKPTHVLLMVLAFFLVHADRALAVCDERLRAATPTARFRVDPGGTATDLRTGLVWQRCPLGTTLDDGGTPGLLDDDRCRADTAPRTFTWSGALVAAQQLNAGGGFAGFTDWRLPNRKELLSIVETRCTSPAINSQVFPDTPTVSFLSATPDVSSQTLVRLINFGTGGDDVTGKTVLHPVRLVR